VWREAEQATRSAEVFLVIGTSEETALSGRLDCSLRGLAGELLPQLIT
jgi:hypothetical protein